MKAFQEERIARNHIVLTGILTASLSFLLSSVAARAQNIPNVDAYGNPLPMQEIIRRVGLKQKLDQAIPLDLKFRDSTGKTVRLGQYFGEKPVMMILIQYDCTMLCNEEMNVLTRSMREMGFTVGEEFNLVTLSIDSRETPKLAAGKKRVYLKAYGRSGAEAGWPFLVGDKASIAKLADALGYYFAYDPKKNQFAHPDGVILLTPEGKISRYFFRLSYPSSGLRLGLVEASHGKIGSPIDAFALLCVHYDPTTGTYSVTIMEVLRLAGIATIFLMGLSIFLMKRRDRRDSVNRAPSVTRSEA